jgi:heme exporter protein A
MNAIHAKNTGYKSELKAHNLSLTRGPRLLFQNLSFGVKAGEALVLRGANGSGKTSLLRVLAGLTAPDGGRATWGAEPIPRGLAIYQGHANALKDDFTAAENLADALAFDGVVVSNDEQMQALEKAGLAGRHHVLARRLSQGQKRRVGLARLFLANTPFNKPLKKPLWLLDEPTNALDAEGVALFEGIVNTHLAQGGMACIATHLPLVFGNAGRDLMLGEA